jgi:hypothetical protein
LLPTPDISLYGLLCNMVTCISVILEQEKKKAQRDAIAQKASFSEETKFPHAFSVFR